MCHGIMFAQQSDSIHLIQGVEIQESRVSSFSSGFKLEKIDSLLIQQRSSSNIANLLSENTTLFLRSYSPGGVATLSVRGTNSSQSAIIWNGININQPNLGMTDLSRLNIFDFNNIIIHHGGNSSLLGSGAIGGGLLLSNTLEFESPANISVMLNAGSTSRLGGAARMRFGKQRFAYSGSVTSDYNRNNFKYTDFYNQSVKLKHAQVRSFSSVHQAEYKLTKLQRLTLGLWYQTTDRELPASMTMTSSDQTQWDGVLRSSLQWSRSTQTNYQSIRLAFINENQNYVSPSALIDAWYKVNTFVIENEYKSIINSSLSIGYGLNFRSILANIDSYLNKKNQNEGALWVSSSYHHQNSGFKGVINLRNDFSQGYKIPFCPSISGEIPIAKSAIARFAISKNFRVPTLNDKFWIPGGNPLLKPEQSWNFDAGTVWEAKFDDYAEAQFATSYYYMIINDLIQWIPGNFGIWSPQNVSQVISHGLESSIKASLKLKMLSYNISLAYNYSPSKLNVVPLGQESNLNKQMIYIPLHKIVGSFKVSKGRLYTSSSFRYIGKRYINSDNTQQLAAYFICDAFAGYKFDCNAVSFQLQTELRNVFGADYQSVMYYPEPGRTLHINLILTTK